MGTDEATSVFQGLRPRLFGIGYRMLGSAAEAEDVVQEVWLRWQGTDPAEVRDPAAFLATTATRIAINVLRSARVRRESYVGPWLPEPVDTAADPQIGAERGAAVETAVLLLLEALNPVERAAYVLREAFDYGYPEIAEIVGVSEPNARQLVSRARRHLTEPRRRTVDRQDHRRLLEAFLHAARRGDMAELERLLAADAVSWSDGGGKVSGLARIAVVGREKVARFLSAFADRFWAGVTLSYREVNGRAAAVLTRDGATVGVLTALITEDGVAELQWQMNPDKISLPTLSQDGGLPGPR